LLFISFVIKKMY